MRIALANGCSESADIADATSETRAVVNLPLRDNIRNDEVTYDVTARLMDVRSDRLVQNRVFSSPELRLVASEEGITIDGPVRLDGVPLTANWRQAFGEAAAEGGRIDESLVAEEIPVPPPYW